MMRTRNSIRIIVAIVHARQLQIRITFKIRGIDIVLRIITSAHMVTGISSDGFRFYPQRRLLL